MTPSVPAERVRQWLEQGEQYMMDTQSSSQAGGGGQGSRHSRQNADQQKQAEGAEPRKRLLRQWLSCFAF